MARAPDPYFEYVEELLSDLGPIAIRRMFGGAGVYAGEVMFGLIAFDQLYLKVDAALKSDLEAEGCGPFTYEKKDGSSATMAYYALPESAADDPAEACVWARRALDVAMKAKSPKAKKRR